MPTNLPKQYFLIEEEYRREKNLDKKIELLKRLISAVPKHKGTEHLLADLRKKLSKLKNDLERKSKKSGSSKQETIKKSGDILVSIIGFTQSGKSTLLSSLTNASVEIEDKPYTTREPVTGVCFFEGVNIQFVEIPSFFHKKDMNIVHTSDLILILASDREDLEKLEVILRENKLENKTRIALADFTKEDYSELLSKIVKESNIVRIFTKPVGKNAEKKAIVLKNGRIVRNLIEKINENWINGFKFARVFDNTRFSGRQVGLEYVLKDKDVVEIHVI